MAASETILVDLSFSYFSLFYGFEYLSFVSFVLAMARLGFLVLNWSPTKIFMGDASDFMGLILGISLRLNFIRWNSLDMGNTNGRISLSSAGYFFCGNINFSSAALSIHKLEDLFCQLKL